MIGVASTAIAAALGIGLGVVTGMPLGVVNVAVVDAAIAGRGRFATGIGIGGALADAVHSALAFVGVGQLVTARPAWTRGMAIAAALIIAGYAIAAWRARKTPPPPDARGATAVRGVLAGTLLTLPNPAALAAWAAIAAAVWPAIATADALVLAAGVGVGSAAWFALLAKGSARVRVDHPARAYVPRVALALLVAIALGGVAHALIA